MKKETQKRLLAPIMVTLIMDLLQQQDTAATQAIYVTREGAFFIIRIWEGVYTPNGVFQAVRLIFETRIAQTELDRESQCQEL